jgi:hypothetical protein
VRDSTKSDPAFALLAEVRNLNVTANFSLFRLARLFEEFDVSKRKPITAIFRNNAPLTNRMASRFNQAIMKLEEKDRVSYGPRQETGDDGIGIQLHLPNKGFRFIPHAVRDNFTFELALDDLPRRFLKEMAEDNNVLMHTLGTKFFNQNNLDRHFLLKVGDKSPDLV